MQALPRVKGSVLDSVLNPSMPHPLTKKPPLDGYLSDDDDWTVASVDCCGDRMKTRPKPSINKDEFSTEDAERFVTFLGGAEHLHDLVKDLWPEEKEDTPRQRPEVEVTAPDTRIGEKMHLSLRDGGKHVKRLHDFPTPGPEDDTEDETDASSDEETWSRETQRRKNAKRATRTKAHTKSLAPVPPPTAVLVPTSAAAKHKEFKDGYYEFEQKVGSKNREEVFGMYSAEMCRQSSKREAYLEWVDTVAAARFLRNDLRLRLEAIKSIRGFVKHFASKHADMFKGVVSVKVS